MRLEIMNSEIITIAQMEKMVNPSSENDLSELKLILSDPTQRSRFVKMWNETRGISIVDNGDSFEVNVNFAPLGANGVLDFVTEFAKDAINEFLPDIRSGKFLTKYAEKKLYKFEERWAERCAQLAEKLRKSDEELFTGEQLKLMQQYLKYRCKEVIAHPELGSLPPVTDPTFGAKYSEWLKHEKEFLRAIGLGRCRRSDGTLETLESFCARAK